MFTAADLNDETGWKSYMLKLVSTSGDENDSSPGFDDKHIYRCKELLPAPKRRKDG